MDPDPKLLEMLDLDPDPYPDPYSMNADPQLWFSPFLRLKIMCLRVRFKKKI